MKRIMFFIMAMVICFPMFAFSQATNTQVTVDLTKLDSQSRNAILNSLKEEEEKGSGVAEVVKSTDPQKWADVAKGIGLAVKELCHSLNVEVNAFIKTDAGRLLTFLLIWKLFGAALVAGLLKVLIIVGCMLIIFKSFKYFHMQRKVKDKDKNIVYESYKWNSNEAKCTSAGVHIILWVICIIIILIIL